MNRYLEDQTTEAGLVNTKKRKGTVKEYQTVVAVGPMVKYINVGDTVFIDPSAYGVPVHKDDDPNSIASIQKTHVEMTYNLPTININGVEHLYIFDRDIEFVADVEEKSDILYTPPTILVN